jgi:anti-anti-sigma regulatory factor
MFTVKVEKIGSVAIVYCKGRLVRSDAAFRLRDAVARQNEAHAVLVDLSAVQALEGGGLGMLLFLQVWARNRGIQFKAFDPSVNVRQSLERSGPTATVEIAEIAEVLSLLREVPEELSDGSQSVA